MQIGPYAIVAELARGGMGAVYRAQDPAGNPVALKLLLGHRNRSERGLRRFAIELETHARLRHPHVVGVRGSGVHEGVPYVVLDYVEGETLQARLDRQGPLPAAEVLRIGRALASALCHAHDHGVVHRDVKPENVLMDRRGQVRLSDFGLALDLESSNERLTLTGHFLGTPGYWAPEQALGRKHALGPPTDVYGLGATLYGLASGRPPLTGSAMAQLDAFDAVPPLVTLQPRAPAGLCALIHGCLRREPQARPRATEVLAELDRLQLETPAARSARLTRSRLIAALVVLTVICGALVCALAWRVHSRALHEAAAPVDAPEGRSPPVAADATRLRAALAAGDFEGTLRELDATPNLDPVDAASLRAAALDGLGRSSEARTVLDEALAHRAAGLLLVQRAELLRKIGDERGARADFERASADPQASHAVLHAVFHELESRRDARARAVIERAIALQPTAEYLMDLAFFHQDRSEPAACLEAARRASALAPTALDPRALIGHSLIALERYPEAEALFVELSRESPDQAHGLIGRARIRARRGELQEAAALYAEAARLEPLGSVSASRYGDVLFELGRDAEALALYTQSLAAAPNAETAFRRGITYEALGDSRAARADFERALRLEPTHVGALARLLRQVGPAEARDLPQLAAALRAAESPFAQLVALGDALRDYDEYALAQGLYEHALALDPDDVEARTSLGLCLANQLQRRAAEEVFDAALERDPRSVRALYLRGANKRYDERYAEALGDLDAALALDPEHAAARVMRADALRHLRRLEEAGVDYALVLQAEPRNLDALVGYADALAAAGDLPRALDLARRAAELHPRSHVAQQTRAEFASAQGLDAEALEAYRGALALAPEDLAIQRQVVGLLLKLDRWEEAAAAADAVLARDPQDPSVRFARATSRRHAERYADAIADYRALLAVAPGDAQLHFGLGDTYLGLEDYPAAEASFREAVRLDATYAPGVYGLGIALARQRAWASALEAFERVLELGFGGEPDFAAELCLARFHADDPARAQAELTRLLADAPTSPALLWAQAELHAAQGEPVAQVHADLERARAGAPSRRLHRLLDALQARLEAR